MDGSVVQWNEELKPARGFMFDVDGTLILSNRSLGGYTVLPGATEVLGTLKARGIPYVLLTNGSNYAPPEQAAKLRGLGLPVEDAQMLTPSSVAADLMQRHGIKRCLVLGTPGVGYALSEAGIEIAFTGEENAAKADAVYIGWHPECGMKDIETAANAIWNGAKLYVASDVPFFASAGGRAMGYSFAITAAVRRLTKAPMILTGKPSLHALRFVARKLGVKPREVCVVGDDPVVEIIMARRGGANAIGVTTGFTKADDWAAQPDKSRPHRILDTISALLNLGLVES